MKEEEQERRLGAPGEVLGEGTKETEESASSIERERERERISLLVSLLSFLGRRILSTELER